DLLKQKKKGGPGPPLEYWLASGSAGPSSSSVRVPVSSGAVPNPPSATLEPVNESAQTPGEGPSSEAPRDVPPTARPRSSTAGRAGFAAPRPRDHPAGLRRS